MQKGEVFASPFLFVSCSGDLLFWRVFLVEHLWCFRPLLPYRPKWIRRMLMSAGDTPGMREAWPMVVGWMRDSFWRASMVMDVMAVKSKLAGIFISSSLFSLSALALSRSI